MILNTFFSFCSFIAVKELGFWAWGLRMGFWGRGLQLIGFEACGVGLSAYFLIGALYINIEE